MHLLKSNKDFALLFYGSLVSEIGSTLYSFAIGLYILSRTGSSAQMGIFLAVTVGVRLLFSPLAGVLVDKWNRIKIIYMADYIRALLFLAAGLFMLFEDSLNMVMIMLYAITVISSMTAAFFGPAVSSSVPEIVGEKDLQAANSGMSIIGSIQSIIGVLIGAAIYSLFGLFWILIINSLSFFVSAVSEMFIHPKFKKNSIVHNDDQSFSEGLRYIRRRKGLISLLLLILFLNFAITPLISIGIPFLFNNLLLRQPIELALFEVVFSVSMLGAGIFIGKQVIHSSNRTVKKAIFGLMIGFLFMSLLIAFISNQWIYYWVFYTLFLLNNGLLGVVIIYVNIPIQTGITLAVEPHFRGRVFSITGSVTQLAVPIAFLLGGYIIEAYSVTVLALACSFIIMIPSILFILNKNVKKLFSEIDTITKEARAIS